MARQPQGRAFAGGDISAKAIVVAVERPDGGRERSSFTNNYLRATLYMPALVASRYDPHVRAFYEKLLEAS